MMNRPTHCPMCDHALSKVNQGPGETALVCINHGRLTRGYRGQWFAAYNPAGTDTTDPAVCSQCNEPALRSNIPRPSGHGMQVECPNLHLTNGMPARGPWQPIKETNPQGATT